MGRNLIHLLLFLVMLTSLKSVIAKEERPNVLFIAVDDLRPELNCYGKKHILSPNIDRLAKSGLLFERAYCMVPTCGASRASMMTGIRPARRRFVNHLTRADQDAPGMTTMNTHFKKNGYYTLSLGKIFHHPKDNAQGWSEPAWRPKISSPYQQPENQKRHREQQKLKKKKRGPAWESADVPDNAYGDGLLAEHAIANLKQLSKKKQPFFMAVGFFKPHLPFVAPQKYWDIYNHQKIQVPENYHIPKLAPKESIHHFGELRAYAGIPAKGKVSNETARNLIHGYYACVSYTDAQIGKLLDELERLDLAKNTIVVLWGDHGWNLGDHTMWCKHSCYESSMHIPFIVRSPGIQGGNRTSGLTESIDLYPSLCELAGLPKPEHLQGRSFVPLLHNPKLAWNSASVGRYRNGDTIRTSKFRFSLYSTPNGKEVSRMLYHQIDDPHENENIVNRKTLNETVLKLSKQLQQQMGHDRIPAKEKISN